VKTKTRIGVAAALAGGLLALASAAAAAEPQARYKDAHERGGPIGSLHASVAGYGDAHERSQVIRSTSPASTGYLDAAERASAGQFVGSAQQLASSASSTGVSIEKGSAWSTAVIGASSALLLVLLFGASVILVRHSRGRPLAR
jgi:hypothetical protein